MPRAYGKAGNAGGPGYGMPVIVAWHRYSASPKNLRRYIRGILASARFPMHTSLLEGLNNRIKVIKRMAYGFRDSNFFFPKIKTAFPGKAR